MIPLWYHIELKFSDRQVWANSVDPDQPKNSVIGSVLFAILFWRHYCIVKTTLICSDLRTIAITVFQESEFSGFLW